MTHVIAGRYELVEPLGRNGTGPVWRARDLVPDREIAVQEVSLPDHLGGDAIGRAHARIVREARAAARLDHPGIVTVHDVVEEGGRPWVAMRFVRARSLAALIEQDGPLPPERVAAIGLDLLDALRAAHAAGIVHRDVEPGNVLLTAGRPVLTGFGIAVDETVRRPAPEQAGGHPATPASDLWALGATLYAAVEGRPPYSSVLPEPDPPRLAGPLTPVLHGLLRADPNRRIGADEAEHLLRQVTAHDTPPVVPPITPPPFPPGYPPPGPLPQGTPDWGNPPGAYGPAPAPPPRQGPRWTVIVPAAVLAVVLVVAAVAAAVLLGLRDDEGPAASRTPSGGAPSASAPLYREHRGDGYVVSVPSGWSVSQGTGEVTFSDTHLTVFREISFQQVIAADDPATVADVSEALQNAARSFADDPGHYPGYAEERFTELRYLGDDAAELQFRFSAADLETRMRMRLFRFDGALYSAILTAQLDRWEESVPHYEMFLRTLRRS
ncbi:protein kinase [Actinomadura sp. LOL_016]|uniref:protein kinase domain-containing protein n=1 Tax=unclassified Actinomadura TaxID=2626254 RepID=UPI003A80CF61